MKQSDLSHIAAVVVIAAILVLDPLQPVRNLRIIVHLSVTLMHWSHDAARLVAHTAPLFSEQIAVDEDDEPRAAPEPAAQPQLPRLPSSNSSSAVPSTVPSRHGSKEPSPSVQLLQTKGQNFNLYEFCVAYCLFE